MRTLVTVAALAVTLVTVISGEKTQTDDGLPRPWLKLDRSAKVLVLQCQPPPQVSNWDAVYDLRMSAFLSHHNVVSNLSLVNMTSSMTEPRVLNIFPGYDVHFQGSWRAMDVSLDFVIPITEKELGHYYCTMQYSDPAGRPQKWTSGVLVDKKFISRHVGSDPKTVVVDGFTLKAVDAHQVKITWRIPKGSHFKEATVSRTQVDRDGNALRPAMSLFTTDGIDSFIYDKHVLLTKLNIRGSGNFSLTVYVEWNTWHSPLYHYSCWIPYPACIRHNADLCTCCRPDTNLDTQICSSPFQESQTYKTEFYVCLPFVLIFGPVLGVVLIVYFTFKIGLCRGNDCIQKIFKEKRKSVDTEDKKADSDKNKTGSVHYKKAGGRTNNLPEEIPILEHLSEEGPPGGAPQLLAVSDNKEGETQPIDGQSQHPIAGASPPANGAPYSARVESIVNERPESELINAEQDHSVH